LAITWPTSGGRSVGIVRSRTQTMEFSLVFFYGSHNSNRSKSLLQVPTTANWNAHGYLWKFYVVGDKNKQETYRSRYKI
jgi:hypothetical protein